jgi:hypothetical protein
MVDNAAIWRDTSGNIKVDKRSRTAKVDGVSATINALALILDPAKQEIESNPEILVIDVNPESRVSQKRSITCSQCGTINHFTNFFCYKCQTFIGRGCPRHEWPEDHPLLEDNEKYFCPDCPFQIEKPKSKENV